MSPLNRLKSPVGRSLLFVLLLLVTLLVCALAVSAQEATPPAPTEVMIVQPNPDGDTVVTGSEPVTIIHDDNPVLLIALGIVALVLLVVLYLWTKDRHKLAEYAERIIPQPILDEFLSHRQQLQEDVDQGFDEADRLADQTPTPIDNLLSSFGRKGAHALIDSAADALEELGRLPAPTPVPPAAPPPASAQAVVLPVPNVE